MTGTHPWPASAPRPRTPGTLAFLAAPQKRLLIDGKWVAATGGGTLPTVDPATGQVLAEIALGTEPDVEAAVAAARRALTAPAWHGMTPSARGRLLWSIGEAIDAHADEFAEIETLDQGKTLRTGRLGEIPAAAEQFRYYAGFTTKILGQTIPTSVSNQPAGYRVVAHTRREPVGVVAAIVPWNSPLLMAAMKLAPALAAGCSVVLKPAEQTSLTALRLGELLIELGLPDGVVNIVTGTGERAGAALAGHAGVDKVAFTGSTGTGKRLLAAASGNLKRLTLELGGKSPVVVFDDADLELVVPGVSRGIFANGGQVCVAGSRVYAQRGIYERLVTGLAEQADGLRLGHGLHPHVDLGPLVSVEHSAKVAAYVDEGVAEGVQVVAGGVRTGAFYRPTVLTGATEQMRLMREEIFGPVVTVTPFDDPDEVLGWANDTDYGLAASVWTRSLSTAHRMSDAIRAGTVWVNCHSLFSPELPKGGHKQSGWGYENGPQGLENYLETKTVCMVL